jgi:hypothetical protein
MLQRQLGGVLGRRAGLNGYGIGSIVLHRGESGLEFLATGDEKEPPEVGGSKCETGRYQSPEDGWTPPLMIEKP